MQFCRIAARPYKLSRWRLLLDACHRIVLDQQRTAKKFATHLVADCLRKRAQLALKPFPSLELAHAGTPASSYVAEPAPDLTSMMRHVAPPISIRSCSDGLDTPCARIITRTASIG